MAHKDTPELNYICNQGICAMINITLTSLWALPCDL